MVNTASSSLNKAHADFLKHLADKGRARATVLAYGKDIEQLVTFLAEKDVVQIEDTTEENLRAFLESLRKDDYTDKSISRKINSIKTFFRFLHKEEVVDKNPAADIKHPKIEIKEPRILSKTEYRALRDAARPDRRIFAIIELFLQTGVRIGELAKILLTDVGNEELTIRNAGGEIDRKIPLNQSAKGAVDRYVEVRPDGSNTHLFITKTGRPLLVRNIRTAIDRYFKEAGIKDATVNDLRNTFIAHQLAGNAPLEYVSEVVGHRRVSTTEKYLDLVEKNENHSKEPRLEEL